MSLLKFSTRPGRATVHVGVMAALVCVGLVPVGAAVATGPSPAGPCVIVAVGDNYATPFETELAISAPGVLGNDETCTFGEAVLVGDVANGSLALNADGSFTYLPDVGFFGNDSFQYLVDFAEQPALRGGTEGGSRPRGSQNQATVTIVVAPPPCSVAAIDDAYETPFETPLNEAVPGVTANDIACGFNVHLFTGPTHGSLDLHADGSFEYTPAAGFAGVDTFEYLLDDAVPGFAARQRLGFLGWRAPRGAVDNVALVTITILAPPATTTTSTTTTSTTTVPSTTTSTLPPPAPTTTTTPAPPPVTLPATR